MTIPARHEGRARVFRLPLRIHSVVLALWRDIPAAFGAVKGQSAASTGISVRFVRSGS
jgi:hypothetical protein